jgi:predicted PurR-regulated permease PerM
MTWLQILAQGAIFATFIGAFIAIAAYFNGKHIKEGVSEIGKMIQATQIFIKETQTLIISEMQQTRQLIEKMEENMMKLEENMMKLEENMMKMEENIMKILGKIYEKVS